MYQYIIFSLATTNTIIDSFDQNNGHVEYDFGVCRVEIDVN